ncbi:hypothetical protein M1295_00415 [Patescibacteria group bacterium]|nr:hypothetical protein [Patescibacteria group bacterium]
MQDCSAALKATIPDSVLPYPDRIADRAKYLLWRMVFPGPYTSIRDGLLAIGLIKHEGRQPYFIGKLNRKDIEPFLGYLKTHGFGNHFVAWEDDDEVIGLRKLDGFDYQYHIRVFNDGEVRGHYEYTPESHCLRHLRKIGHEPKPEYFSRLLSGWSNSSN